MAITGAPTLADVHAARGRLSGVARVTPVYRSETFTRLTGRPVHLKAENLQRTGSFKIRGAFNRIAMLGEAERRAGVATASAGNHGQAVAWAAREAGIAATIFMPQDAPMAKVDATRSYGATVELAGEGFDEAVAACREHISRAIVLLLERAKLVVEGAGAAGVAALLAGLIDGDDPTCALLSGGNIDPTLLMQVTRHGLTASGRYLVVRTCVPDRPGELLGLLQLVAGERVNVVSVSHRREGVLVGLGETEIELTLATRDEAHCDAVLAALRDRGYAADRLS